MDEGYILGHRKRHDYGGRIWAGGYDNTGLWSVKNAVEECVVFHDIPDMNLSICKRQKINSN